MLEKSTNWHMCGTSFFSRDDKGDLCHHWKFHEENKGIKVQCLTFNPEKTLRRRTKDLHAHVVGKTVHKLDSWFQELAK